jgi:hypothetical protein
VSIIEPTFNNEKEGKLFHCIGVMAKWYKSTHQPLFVYIIESTLKKGSSTYIVGKSLSNWLITGVQVLESKSFSSFVGVG